MALITASSPRPDADVLSPTAFLAVFRAQPIQRITLAKEGLKARDAQAMLARFPIPANEICKALNISRASLGRKAARDKRLSAAESERLLGLAKLAGQVQFMVTESGRAEGFVSESWLSTWLMAPLPALCGGRPVDLIDTMEGQDLVSTFLAQMQSGAYA